MTDLREIQHCPNCGSSNINKFCSNCGQKIYKKRFTLKGFFGVVGNALNIEKGFLHTAVWMFYNPGIVINNYLKGKTKSYFNPLNYILIVAGIYAFLVLSLDILDRTIEATNEIIGTDTMQASPEVLEFQKKWIEFIKSYVNFIPILMIPFAGLFSKWYYAKRKLYYGEHLIINTFIFAQSILISVIISPLASVFPGLIEVFPLINICYTLIYFSYALFKIFKQSIVKAIFGSIVIYFGGFIFFMLFIMIALILAIVIMKLTGFSINDLLN